MQAAVRWALYILGIEILFLVALQTNQVGVVPPLAASFVLLAANPQGVFARPKTVLLAYVLVGHLGLLNSVFWGNNLFCLFVITLLAVALLATVPCIHPPAIAILFQLSKAPAPFQTYLIMVALVGGMLGFHFAAQWFHAQVFPESRPNPLPLAEPNQSGFSTIFSAIKNG